MTALMASTTVHKQNITEFISSHIELYLTKAQGINQRAKMDALAQQANTSYINIWRYYNKHTVPPATKSNIILGIVRSAHFLKSDFEAISYIPKDIQEYYDIVNCERQIWKTTSTSTTVVDLNNLLSSSESARWIYIMTRAGGYITKEIVLDKFGKSGAGTLEHLASLNIVSLEGDKYTTGKVFAAAQTPEAGVSLSRTIMEETTPEKIHQKKAACGNVVVRLDNDKFITAKKIISEAYRRIVALDQRLNEDGRSFGITLNIAELDLNLNEQSTPIK